MGLSYEEFKRQAAELAGVDLGAYKSQQMDRRLHSLMHSWGLSGYDEYLSTLQTDPARMSEFQKRLTINVSEFFRNPDRFVELERVILPELCKTGRRLRIWSAGCANGAEPYTLAIIMRESGYEPGAQIIGSDIDRESLRRAQAAVFNPNEVRFVPPALLGKYFTEHGGGFALQPEIRRMVEFKRHNLLHDGWERGFDLILCRNVVIYLTESAKDALYRKIHQALRPGGYLMVGGTEPMLNYRSYGLDNPISAFYRRVV